MTNMGKRKPGAQASYEPGQPYQAPTNKASKGSSRVVGGANYVHGKGPGTLGHNPKVNKHTTKVDTNSPKSNAGHGKRPW